MTGQPSARAPFRPFYTRVAGGSASKIGVSILLGVAFLAAHFVTRGSELFADPRDDWSWFLAVLITGVMLLLYYATHTFLRLLPQLDARVGADEPGAPSGSAEAGPAHRAPLLRLLSDRRFVYAGFFFAALNVLFGLAFGLPYEDLGARATVAFGYFVAGFACGMAVWGIWGVLAVLRSFAATAREYLDFTSPDGCGGTQFLGDALVIFSSVTLCAGVMISVYILKTDWSSPETWWVIALKAFWIAWPYLASLTALFGPALAIRRSLIRYKDSQDDRLAAKLKTLNAQARAVGDPGARDALHRQEDYVAGQRSRLQRMRTWPFGSAANSRYAAVFLMNLIVSARATFVWVRSIGT